MKPVEAVSQVDRRSVNPIVRVGKSMPDWVIRVARSLFDTVFAVGPMATDDDLIRFHTIMIDNAGRPLPLVKRGRPLRTRMRSAVCGSCREMSDQEYRAYLQDMMARIEATRDATPNGVLVIVHGGLERLKKSFKNTKKAYREIFAEGYYPVFVNWDSWLFNAYCEQLFFVRSGRYSQLALFTWPLYLAADLLMVVARLIPAWFAQVRLAWRRRRGYEYPSTADLGRFAAAGPNLNVNPGVFKQDRSWWRTVLFVPRLILELVVFPFRIVAASAITALGPRTWQNLLRRVGGMFRAPREFDRNVAEMGYQLPDGVDYSAPEGAMAVFLNELAKLAHRSGTGGEAIKVSLIAHSLGSMITNRAIQWMGGDLDFNSIVYMAPACSVREFVEAVVPALERNTETRAHVLTLHPKVEASEVNVLGLAPRGSVLEWIEGFVDPPGTHLDRMLGKWDNILRSTHVLKRAVRTRVYLKSFPYDASDPKKPYKHVHFNDPDTGFWRPAFLQ